MLERHTSSEVRGHHDHASDPEEDDVVACDQDAAGKVKVYVPPTVTTTSGIRAPAKRAERHQRTGVPRVQHIFISTQGFARCLGLSCSLIMGHINLAVFVVPSRDLVTPPQLARDAPIGDVVHPLVVGVDPVLGNKLHFARLHCINGFLRNAFATGVMWADFIHGDKPLVGQHGFNHLAGAGANGQHQFVRLDFQHQTHVVQILVVRFACGKPV